MFLLQNPIFLGITIHFNSYLYIRCKLYIGLSRGRRTFPALVSIRVRVFKQEASRTCSRLPKGHQPSADLVAQCSGRRWKVIFETQSSIVNPGLFSECTQMMFSVGASVCNVWLHLPKTSWLDWHLMAMIALIIKHAGRFPCGFDEGFQVRVKGQVYQNSCTTQGFHISSGCTMDNGTME